MDTANAVEVVVAPKNLLPVVVFVHFGRDVVDELQDLLNDGFFACPDGSLHIGQLHTSIGIDFRCNSFAAAHMLY